MGCVREFGLSLNNLFALREQLILHISSAGGNLVDVGKDELRDLVMEVRFRSSPILEGVSEIRWNRRPAQSFCSVRQCAHSLQVPSHGLPR